MNAITAEAVTRVAAALREERYPDTLYHYTTLSGCLGILESKSLWATDVGFLNDASESALAVHMMRSVLKTHIEEAPPESRAWLTRLEPELTFVFSPFTFVASFSHHSDQLSQWRAYGRGGGIALGLDVASLMEVCEADNWVLAKCIYAEDEQRALLRLVSQSSLDAALRLVADGMATEEVEQHARAVFRSALGFAAPFIKDKSFHEEAEWRVVTQVRSPVGDHVHFRASQSLVIPYTKFPLALDGARMKLNLVVAGPSPHPRLLEQGLARALHNFQVAFKLVDTSAIPYRNW